MNRHMAVFLTFYGLSVLHSLFASKIVFLSAFFEDGNYSAVALCGLWTLGKLNAISMIAYEDEKIERLLETLENYLNAYPKIGARRGTRNKLEFFVNLAIGLTFGTVVLHIFSVFNLGIENALLTGSHTLSKCLFLWNDGNLSEKGLYLKYEYGSELTVLTAVMGGIVIASEIASILHTGMVVCLTMVLAVCVHTYVAELLKDIREFRGERRQEKVEEWKRWSWKSLAFWRKFRMLRDIIKAADIALFEMFNILFMAGLVAPQVFMKISFWETPTIEYSILLVNLFFLQVWFIYLGKMIVQNDELSEWISNSGVKIGSVHVDGVLVDPQVVLKVLEKNPMGLGVGKFVIRYSLHYFALKIFNRVWVAVFGDDY